MSETKVWDFGAYLKPWKEEKLVEGLADTIYHAEPACSNGQLQTIADKEGGVHKLFDEKNGNPRKETPALRFGSMFHKAALEGSEFLKRYKVIPEFTGFTKDGRPSTQSADAKAKRQAWILDQPPETIFIEGTSELDQITGMLQALKAHPEASDLLSGGTREVTGFFNYEGMRCRIRMDVLREDEATIIDLKTTKNALSNQFHKQMVDELYFMQAWFYLVGGAKLLGKAMKFKFIAIEKEPPYLVSVHEVGESFLSCGDVLVKWSMAKLKAAIETGVWLPEPQTTFTAEAPQWLMDRLTFEGAV